ncbi:hypothetical protein ABK040_013141 [Willaertia magna]
MERINKSKEETIEKEQQQIEQIEEKEEFKILIFNLTFLSRPLKFLIIAFIVLFGYLLAGIIQEYIFQISKFNFGIFLTLCQFLMCSFCAGIENYIFKLYNKDYNENKFILHESESGYFNNESDFNKLDLLPSVDNAIFGKNKIFKLNNSKYFKYFKNFNYFKYYFILAFTMVLGMGLSNEAMNYLNFPTKILFKSSKLLITMFIGVVMLKHYYKFLDYLASIFLIIGLYTLYNANQIVSIELNMTGVILICFSLFFDSISSNLQEKLLREMNRKENELIYYSYLIGSIFLLIICILFNQFIPAILFCYQNLNVTILIILYCFICYIGAFFIHKMIKLFGVLICLTTTCLRKVLSILLSYLLFPKPLVFNHILAIILIFSGVFIRVYCKNKEAIDDLIFRMLSSKKRNNLNNNV